MNDRYERPAGVDDESVAALGALTEAVEYVERARGRLYDFHQLIGRADQEFEQAAHRLDAAGHDELAARLRRDVLGRNVLDGRWTFQVVDEFDDGYWATVRAAEADARTALLGGRRHVFEAEMKERRRSAGQPDHERRPPS